MAKKRAAPTGGAPEAAAQKQTRAGRAQWQPLETLVGIDDLNLDLARLPPPQPTCSAAVHPFSCLFLPPQAAVYSGMAADDAKPQSAEADRKAYADTV